MNDLRQANRVLALLGKWSGLPVGKNASARLRAEIALARRSPAAAALVDAVDLRLQTPLAFDFLLYAAWRLHRWEQGSHVHDRIVNGPDVLLKWDDRPALPGLFWRAQCPSGAEADVAKTACPLWPVKQF